MTAPTLPSLPPELRVPDGYTLLRAEDYSALQDIAGPALAWGAADKALSDHDAAKPDGFDFVRGGWPAAYNRWLAQRAPLAERERETMEALFAAIRRATTPEETPDHER